MADENFEQVRGRYSRKALTPEERQSVRWAIDERETRYKLIAQAKRAAAWFGIIGTTLTAIKLASEYWK